MFFFFFDNAQNIIEACLNIYFRNKNNVSYYYDVSDLFIRTKKSDLQKRIQYKDKYAYELLKHNYPDTEEDLSVLSSIFNDYYEDLISDYDVAFSILYWSFKIFKKKKPFENNKSEIMGEFVRFLNNNYKYGFNYSGTIVYRTDKIDMYEVNNLTAFLNTLRILDVDENCYYRGHSKISYKLTPSIMRNELLEKNERNMYQELVINCPNEFNSYKKRIDYLVKMQHYGLPTRLLDITRNPLVALYFACSNNREDSGEVIIFKVNNEEIKSYYSNAVELLATLPLLSYDEQIDMMDYLYLPQGKKPKGLLKLVGFMKEENQSFVDSIKNRDLDDCYVVRPKRENERILKQDGAFFICGINNSIETKINEKRLLQKGKMPVINILNKSGLIHELDLLSINKSTLFPEIDNVAEYIKNRYAGQG